MGVFKHDGLVVERGVPRDHIPVNKATHIVIYQVKIIASRGLYLKRKFPLNSSSVFTYWTSILAENLVLSMICAFMLIA